MKRIVCLLLVITVMLSLCSCGSTNQGPPADALPPLETDDSSGKTGSSTSSDPKVVYSQTMDNGLLVEIYDDKSLVLSRADLENDLRDDRVLAGHLNGILTIEFGERVHSICTKAFVDFTTVKKIIFGDEVNTIGQYSFAGCTALADIRFGSAVDTIDDRAFSGCTALKDILFSDSVHALGDYVFENCTALRNVAFGSGIETVGNYVFSGCTQLVSASFESNVPIAVFSDCTSLESVSIDSSVQEIGDRAFSGWASLTSVSWPKQLTVIHAEAFKGCSSLGLLAIDSLESNLTICEGAFSGCTKLVVVSLPEGIIEIKERCFEGCTAMERLTLPKTLKTIGGRFISGCTAMRDLWFRGTESEFRKVKKANDWIKGDNNLSGVTKYRTE